MYGAYATIPIFGKLRRLYREEQMKFLVSSLEKPENLPLYSLHTDLDSFILCNDESSEGSESKNRDTNKETEPMDFNIMATLDSEESDIENFQQCTETKTQSKPEIECSQLMSHPSQAHTPHQERNDVRPKSQHLWEMNFDGSCTRKTVGAGVWVHNTESDYAESHAFSLNFKCKNNITEYEEIGRAHV